MGCGLGVCLRVIGASGIPGGHSTNWVGFLKCEKFDHNIARQVPMINFVDGTNIALDYGRQVQAVHVSGQCSEEGETVDGDVIATKQDLETFAWLDWGMTSAGRIAIYWVENGIWYFVEGKVSALAFGHDPSNAKWWIFKLDLNGASIKSGADATIKQQGTPWQVVP